MTNHNPAANNGGTLVATDQAAPYTGLCPEWCVSNSHGLYPANVDFHFATEDGAHDVADVGNVLIEVAQHVIGETAPSVALYPELLGVAELRLTLTQAELIAQRILAVVGEIRRTEAADWRPARVLTLD